MSFIGGSQVFTFSNPIKYIFTQKDSILVITSNPPDTIDNQFKHTDGICLLKLDSFNNQFDSIYNGRITLNLSTKIEHYWMEDSLYAQDNNGNIWKGFNGQAYSLTNKLKHFGAHENYVWGQYNTRTNNYDRYCIAPEERYGYQTYALLDRKGRPNRIYNTAKTINKFIKDKIDSIIIKGKWEGAYFSTKPNQLNLDSLKIIKDSNPNPLPLIRTDHSITNRVLFGLFTDNCDNQNLLVINMEDSLKEVKFCLNRTLGNDSIHCDKITRMGNAGNPQPEIYTQYIKIKLNNMLGGECAILHLTRTPNP